MKGDMKRIVSGLTALLLVLGLCACGQKAAVEETQNTPTWQEQYDLGIRYLSEGNYEEAIIAFTAAIEIDPKQPAAYLKAAEAYEALGDAEKARIFLEQGLQATGDERFSALLTPEGSSWQEQYSLGVRYLEEGNYEEAILAFTAAIEIDPMRPEAYAGAADAYAALGDTENLIAILKQGMEATGDNSLSIRLEELQSTKSDTTGEQVEPQVVKSNSVAGTLDISNFQYQYEAGWELAELNEGAIGGIVLSFTVNAPANAADVWIWTWSENGFSEAEIPLLINEAIEVWKSESTGERYDREVPFDTRGGFPVFSEDQGTVVDVLLIGIDKDINSVGYAIVTVEIP